MVCQGLVLAYESMGCGNAIVSQDAESGRLYLRQLWDSSVSDLFYSLFAREVSSRDDETEIPLFGAILISLAINVAFFDDPISSVVE